MCLNLCKCVVRFGLQSGVLKVDSRTRKCFINARPFPFSMTAMESDRIRLKDTQGVPAPL